MTHDYLQKCETCGYLTSGYQIQKNKNSFLILNFLFVVLWALFGSEYGKENNESQVLVFCDPKECNQAMIASVASHIGRPCFQPGDPGEAAYARNGGLSNFVMSLMFMDTS